MQTAIWVYLTIWILVIVPLICFNIKRMSIKEIGTKRRIKWHVIAILAALIAVISGFLYYSYTVTLTTRYELFAERYVDLHADYATGKITYDEYISKSAPLLTSDSDTSAITNELSSSQGSHVQSVRFQVSSWIIPKYYKDTDIFPKTEVIDPNNPVFVIYLLESGSTLKYYLIEMVWNDNGGWKVAYHAPATKEQVDAVPSAMPSPINGKWFSISA